MYPLGTTVNLLKTAPVTPCVPLFVGVFKNSSVKHSPYGITAKNTLLEHFKIMLREDIFESLCLYNE